MYLKHLDPLDISVNSIRFTDSPTYVCLDELRIRTYVCVYLVRICTDKSVQMHVCTWPSGEDGGETSCILS